MQERGYSRAASKEKADLGLHQYLPLWDTPLHLIGGGDFPVIGVLFIGRTEFGGRNRLVGGKFQKRTPIHNEIQRAA